MRYPLAKILQNIPIKSLAAFSQTVIGFGAGLLIADKLKRPARQKTAFTLVGAGIAAFLPIIITLITHLLNKPQSERSMRHKLESIRRDTGFSDDGF
ncbi:MAG: hypothetical protein ABI443_03520 [Chthoniobacterales bacterium]